MKGRINMEKLKKKTSRLSVQYVDADTDELIFEVNNRNHTNACELMSDYSVNNVFEQNNLTKPKNLMVLIIGEFSK